MIFEQLALYPGGSDTASAFTAITDAFGQCNEMTFPATPVTRGQTRHDLRAFPRIAPSFIGSEVFVDQQTRGAAKSYEALVVARRGTTVIAVAVANQGAVDIRLVRQLVSAALHRAPA